MKIIDDEPTEPVVAWLLVVEPDDTREGEYVGGKICVFRTGRGEWGAVSNNGSILPPELHKKAIATVQDLATVEAERSPGRLQSR